MSLFPEERTTELMPATALVKTSSTILKLSLMPNFLSTKVKSLSFGIMTMESLSFFNSEMPDSASFNLFLPSNIKGLVITETVNAPTSLAA